LVVSIIIVRFLKINKFKVINVKYYHWFLGIFKNYFSTSNRTG